MKAVLRYLKYILRYLKKEFRSDILDKRFNIKHKCPHMSRIFVRYNISGIIRKFF